MGYINKDYGPLINTRITDGARKKMSEGNFNISYFQVGDSEVCYSCVDELDLPLNMIIQSEYNFYNNSGGGYNKAGVKYPLPISEDNNNTFGIPFENSYVDNIFNTTQPRGFFNGENINSMNLNTSSGYTINCNKRVLLSSLNGGSVFTIQNNTIDSTANGTIEKGDIVTLFFNSTSNVTPINGKQLVLTYRVVSVEGSAISVDRELPNLNSMGYTGYARAVFYPNNMTDLYDTLTPEDYWGEGAINFECNDTTSQRDVLIWNMNIPWTEPLAGMNSSYTNLGSLEYTGSKEYLGYNSDSGQTDTGEVYYNNSLKEKVVVNPSEQKSIAIVHYSNNNIDDYYGEKFALEGFDSSNPGETGQARNFKIKLPWIMWHKSSDSTMGETFYVDPPGYDNLSLNQVKYIERVDNDGTETIKLRYFNLWDTNTNNDGYPNRVGKVWPDLKIVTFDDDEIVAALSYKSNRNWTLPAPKVNLYSPVTSTGTADGLLADENDTLYVTYRLDNTSIFTNSLHCNYYQKITGLSNECEDNSHDITLRFGSEFKFLIGSLTGTHPNGFVADKIKVLVQKVSTGQRPDPAQWREIDVTSQITNGVLLNETDLTSTSISVTKSMYDSAGLYNLTNYINLPANGITDRLRFGDEYYFYGLIETDAQATIYVMNYLCNLTSNQFNSSNNPTWDITKKPRITEIGLYDNNKELMIISKVQSPQERIGVQQYSIKIDF